ncbi:DUF2510 domain-containing protein [Leifsonia xyli]|uniref:DUF2510 domain-containing protein n=1 Tax=Leifsonia xyli TaxID=1575 RepID=UPI003D66ED25
MTDQNAPAPGWYPDPQGSGALRWWDGAHWTEHAAPVPAPAPAFAPAAAGPSPYGVPYAPARRRPLPADTPIYTPWIWLVAALPLVSTLLLFLLHPQPVFASTSGSPSRVVVTDPMALLGGPVYFLVIGIGWLITAACIVFAWLDYRELVRRGVERPFHWAWSFFGIVYPIGRSVVVRGVAGGRGLAPMWVAIGVTVASFVIALVWSITLVAQILGTLSTQVPPGA